VVIIADEAQSLNDETLEELRLFSNRGRINEKQLHFVLVAQPELLRRLTRPELQQLNDRIGARAVLNSLTAMEATGYVECRIKAHGGNPTKLFARGALPYLIKHSGGIPRRINLLCHNAMLLAYSAGRHEIDLHCAHAAVAEYENLFARRFGGASTDPKRPLRWCLRVGARVGGVPAIGLLSFATTLMWPYRANFYEPTPAVAPTMVSTAVRAPALSSTAMGRNAPSLALRESPGMTHKILRPGEKNLAPSPEVADVIGDTFSIYLPLLPARKPISAVGRTKDQ
jgi:hypothetical protein